METQVQLSKLKQFSVNFVETKLPLNEVILSKSKEVLNNFDFPTTRDEQWKYTRLTKLSQLSLHQTSNSQGESKAPLNNSQIISIVNGNLASISTIEEVNITKFSEATEEKINMIGKYVNLDNNIFNALNSLYINDGLFIEVNENQQIENPIQLILENNGQGAFCPVRIFIHAKKGSSASFLLNFSSSTESFSLPVIEYHVGQNARLSIDKIQLESEKSFSISTDQVYQERDSYFKINTISLSGKFIRNSLNILVDGENCETHLNGAYLPKDDHLVDNHTVVDHLQPNCNSNELYKGVLNGKSIGVFNGKVFVRTNAQKINAFQSNANVLISDDASMNSKPELEIYADDVKCSHGSTTGQMDEDAIFYLRARGISEKSAKALMTQAFIGDVLNKIDNEEILNYVHVKLEELHGWSI
ncbi:MAG: Fe-S cluster assembly protein SufD [Bacteroidota bacterium]